MKEVLDVHNSLSLDVDLVCERLIEFGWNAKYKCGISRTKIYSDASISTAEYIMEEVMTEPCVNCGCNPIIKNKEVA